MLWQAPRKESRKTLNSKLNDSPMDPHRNLFFAYSGPLPKDDDWGRRKQLEDNTTKALVNIIEWTSVGASAFLESLQPPLACIVSSHPTVEVSLQRRPWFVQASKNRRLIAITGHFEDDPPTPKAEQSGGRPDAWLYFPEADLTLMIESKLGQRPDEQQLRGHLQQAGWRKDTPRIHTSWSDLYTAFKRIVSSLRDSADSLLMKHFLGFLEVIGMSPFDGFLAEDFDYFLTYPEEYRHIVKPRLQQFARLVYDQIPAAVRRRFPKFYVPPLKKGKPTGTWIGFRRPDKTDSLFQHCNLTIEINSEGLTVNAALRDGRFDKPQTSIGQVYSLVRGKPSEIVALLGGLGSGHRITIYRRTNRAGHERILPGAEIWNAVMTHALERLPYDFAGYLATLLKEIKYPGIHVSRFISRGDIILKEKEKLVQNAVHSATQLNSVLAFFDSEGGD